MRTKIASCVFAAATALAPAGAQPDAAGPPLGPTPGPGLDPPAAEGAMAYRLSPGKAGPILCWLEPDSRGVRLLWSRFGEGGWSDPALVTEQRSGIVSNWADLPAVVEGGDGAMYAHWLRRTGSGDASYDIAMLRSTDEGRAWDDLGKLNDDAVVAEHGFVSYVPLEEGLRAYWLDGRETGGGHGEGAGKMTLRTALVGAAIGASELVDGAVCDCCNTAAAMTPGGPVVAYRDRAEGEIRDISVAGGAPGAERPVHADGWKMPGCPVNGPAMDAEGERVVVAWYTGSPKTSVKAAFSGDGGATFGEPIVVDETKGASVPLGRVDVVLDGESALVCWIRNERRRGALIAQRVGPGGPIGEAMSVAPMDGSRASGFPQMERCGDRVIVVWRDVETQTLRTSEIDAAALGG